MSPANPTVWLVLGHFDDGRTEILSIHASEEGAYAAQLEVGPDEDGEEPYDEVTFGPYEVLP